MKQHAMDVPTVVVAVITYNQEAFIAQALDSLLRQRTTFSYRILIADDASTDATPDIVGQYAARHPDRIQAILRETNLGVTANLADVMDRIDAEFVVLNEGDDFFIDDDKLEEQVAFLRANPDFALCFHPARVFYEGEANDKDVIYPSLACRFHKDRLYLDDLLKRNFMCTNSVMYRWRFNATDNKYSMTFPKGIIPCDWFLHLLHAQKAL